LEDSDDEDAKEWAPTTLDAAKQIKELERDVITDCDEKYFEETGVLLNTFWNSGDTVDLWANRAGLQVQDSLQYFMNAKNFNRIWKRSYHPSVEDCLNVRARTTGIVEEYLTISNRKFQIVDVGGQRSERKKWIKCFEGVTGIIFVVSLSGYTSMLFEDGETNRLKESLKVFEDLNRDSFSILKDASLIIFLNKGDLFEDYIRTIPLSTCFSEYKQQEDQMNLDPNSADYADAAFNYVKQKFLEKSNNVQERKVYVHKTCATNIDQMKVIFDVVNHTIINRALVKAGLLVA